MSKYLIQDKPLILLPKLACLIGDRPAIFIQQLHYWIQHKASMILNETDKKHQQYLINRHVRYGNVWIYNTYKEWKDQFPFWSEKTIIRIAENLENKDLIMCDKFDKHKGRMTIWYTIPYDRVDGVLDHLNKMTKPFGQNDYMQLVKMSNSYNKEVTETNNTEITTDTKKYNKKDHKDGCDWKLRFIDSNQFVRCPCGFSKVSLVDIERERRINNPKPPKKHLKDNSSSSDFFTLELFEDVFWLAAYRKTNKKASLKAFLALNKPDVLNGYKPSENQLKLVLSKWIEQNEEWKKQNADKKYVPHPSTWLNGHRWNDEIEKQVRWQDLLPEDDPPQSNESNLLNGGDRDE